ncbi:hypothetical protein ACFY1B_50990 [Streptomyces mirabilis]|uniref:hypothetical protein n=1 Tax=Streptomyces mirabilis TaxID=68239 RepID=UPI0036CBAA9B
MTLCRGTHPFTELAFIDARDYLTRWFTGEQSGEPLRQRWNGRLEVLGEDPFGDPHRPSEPRIEAATYPEVIVLTGLFTSPHRRDHPQLPTEAARRFGVAQTQLGPGLVRKLPPSLRILEQGVSPP